MYRDEVEKYINKKLNVLKENPWKEYPDFTTFKHEDSKKWFALIMEVQYEKLKIEKAGIVDVINLKNIPDMIGSLRINEGILPAYHMNKEHWISVLLDGSVELKRIYELIDLSYELTMKNKRKK